MESKREFDGGGFEVDGGNLTGRSLEEDKCVCEVRGLSPKASK